MRLTSGGQSPAHYFEVVKELTKTEDVDIAIGFRFTKEERENASSEAVTAANDLNLEFEPSCRSCGLQSVDKVAQQCEACSTTNVLL